MALLRKALAAAVSAALILTAPGLDFYRVWAQDPAQTERSKTLVKQLIADGILKDAKDPMLPYIVTVDGSTTPLGSFLMSYEHLKSEVLDVHAAQRTDAEIGAAFKELRESGDAGRRIAEKRQAITALAKRLEGVGLGSPTNAFMAVSQMMTVLTAVKEQKGPAKGKDLTPVYVGDTVEYYDAEGRLEGVVRSDGRILRSRQVEQQQIEFNKLLLPDAPVLNVTGVMDAPTLLAEYFKFSNQLKAFDYYFHYERTIALAQILHVDKQYRPQQFDPNVQAKEREDGKTLEEKFLTEHPGGSRYEAQQLLDPTFNQRAMFLKRAADGLREVLRLVVVESTGNKDAVIPTDPREIRRMVENLKTLKRIPDSKVRAIELKHRDVGLLLTQAYYAGEQYHLKNGKAALTGEDMRLALEQAPGSKEQKAQLEALKPRLAKRMDAVQDQIDGIMKELSSLSLNLPADDPRVAVIESRLDLLSTHLTTVESQNRQVQDDANTFSSVLGNYTASNKVADAPIAVKLWDWAVEKVAPRSEQITRAYNIKAGNRVLKESYEALQKGDFVGAKKPLITLAPEAWKTRWSSPVFGGAGGAPAAEPSQEEKVAAALSSFAEMVGVQAKRDFYVELGGDLLKGAIVATVAAPMASQVFTALGTRMIATATEMAVAGGGFWRSAASVGLKAGGEILVHSGTLLSNLSDKKGVIRPFRYNERMTVFYNAMRTQLAVSANLALISGGMQAMMAGSPTSPYRNRMEAFVEGGKSGAKFVAENPWMLYVGLPTTIIGRGNTVSRVLSNYGESGAVGGTSRTISNIFQKDIDVIGRAAGFMQKGGAVGQSGSFMLVTADQVAKYYAGAHLMGWAARKAVYYGSELGNPEAFGSQRKENGRLKELSEDTIKRARERIDRAERVALFTMNWGWLLIPTASAAGSGARRDQLMSESGFWEYKAANRLHELVNAEGAVKPMSTVPKTSLIDVMFGRHQSPGPGEATTFKVTEAMDIQATVAVLKELAPTLASMYRMTRLEGNQVLGKLKPRSAWKDPKVKEYEWSIQATDKVRDQAQILFEQMALKDPVTARRFMTLTKGRDLGIKQEISRVFLEAFGPEGQTPAGKAWSRMKDLLSGQGPAKGTARAEIITKATEVLSQHLRTEREVDAKAKVLVDRVAALDGASKAFSGHLEALRTETSQWKVKKDADTKGQVGAFEEAVLAGWKEKVDKDASLSQPQRQTLNALNDYLLALRERFTDGKMTSAQGKPIPAFRTKQTELLVDFLTSFSDKGAAEEGRSPGAMIDRGLRKAQGGEWTVTQTTRKYLLLSTGGGKTLLAFEGILPVAKADAAAKGKKLAYMTANPNLVAQARMDYKSFKKLLTKIEIISMSEFTTRVAKGRYMGGTAEITGTGAWAKIRRLNRRFWQTTLGERLSNLGRSERAEDYYMLADEVDKMAEDAVKTIGEEALDIHPLNADYRGLQNLQRKIEANIGKIGETPAPTFATQFKRLARVLLGDMLGAVTPQEMGAKVRSDLGKLRREHHRLAGKAEILHASEVRKFEEAVAAKEAWLKTPAEKRKGEPDPSPLGLEALKQGLAQSRERHAQAMAQAEQLNVLVDGMVAAGSGRGDALKLHLEYRHGRETAARREQIDGKQARVESFEKTIAELDRMEAGLKNDKTLDPAAQKERIAQVRLERMRAKSDKARLQQEQTGLREELKVLTERHEQALKDLQEVRDLLKAGKTTVAADALPDRVDALLENHEKLLEGSADGAGARSADRVLAGQAHRLRNVILKAGGTGHAYEAAPAKLKEILQAHETALQASTLPRARKAELRANLLEMAGLLEAKAGQTLVSRLSKDYRTTLPEAIKPETPLYEVFKAADQEVARWMDSPLRRNNDARVEWAQELTALGKDARLTLERAKSDPKAREIVKDILKRQDELLAMASPEAGSPYIVRDAAKAAELKTVLEKMLEVAQRGGGADELAALATRHGELVPEAVVAVDWGKAFGKQLTALSKKYGQEFTTALERDPHMSRAEKGKLWLEFQVSKYTGKGWVHNELLNLAYGHLEDQALVRYDSQDGKVHVVHVGEWAPTMDTPTIRRWGLHYGTKLNMPYTHKAKATVRDLTSNPEANVIALSGTKQEKLQMVGTDILGHATPREKGKPLTFRSQGDIMRAATRKVLANSLSKTKLSFIGFSNTRELKVLKQALEQGMTIEVPNPRTQEIEKQFVRLQKDEIAQIFSDTEFLRTQRPKADVISQTNLSALKTGKVKVVLVDMLVGGRGLDLDFKSYGKEQGYKGVGYKEVEMIILNPYKMSPGHYVQFQGRISPDRVLGGGKGEPKAKRRYFDYIDMGEAVRTPALKELAKSKGGAKIDEKFVIDNLLDAQKSVQQELLENSEAIERGGYSGRSGVQGLTK